MLPPGRGKVRTVGLDPYVEGRKLSRRLGYLAQRFSLYEDLTVDENIAFFAEIHGVRGWKPRREELVTRIGLKPFRSRLAGRLSGGMKQKLALAATLVHVPELLILDESTSGVDPVSRREFWKILGELVQEGLTVVLTTPYLDEAERCHRVALLHQGVLLDCAEPETIKSSMPGQLVEIIVSPRHEALARLRQHPLVNEVEIFGERLHLRVTSETVSFDTALHTLQTDLDSAGFELSSITPLSATLEDVFIHHIRQAMR